MPLYLEQLFVKTPEVEIINLVYFCYWTHFHCQRFTSYYVWHFPNNLDNKMRMLSIDQFKMKDGSYHYASFDLVLHHNYTIIIMEDNLIYFAIDGD